MIDDDNALRDLEELLKCAKRQVQIVEGAPFYDVKTGIILRELIAWVLVMEKTLK